MASKKTTFKANEARSEAIKGTRKAQARKNLSFRVDINSYCLIKTCTAYIFPDTIAKLKYAKFQTVQFS